MNVLAIRDYEVSVGQTEYHSNVFCFCSKVRFYCQNLISQVNELCKEKTDRFQPFSYCHCCHHLASPWY